MYKKIADALEIEPYLLFVEETEKKKGGLFRNEGL